LLDTDETFTERVDVTTQSDGAFIGTLEIDVRHGDLQQDRIAALLDENTALRAEVLTLRNRVRELEAVLNGLD
jgi:regulator of replication initiation timing